MTEEEWQKFLAYVAGFYANLSNYHSFGHMKFVPDITPAKFWGILESHPDAQRAGTPMNLALE